MSARATLAGKWRREGWEVAQHLSAPDAAQLRGCGSDDELRQVWVRQCWPQVSAQVRRYIREGWRTQRAGLPRP